MKMNTENRQYSRQTQRKLEVIDDLIARFTAESAAGYLDREIASEIIPILTRKRRHIEETE
jgi:hypothetical protein